MPSRVSLPISRGSMVYSVIIASVFAVLLLLLVVLLWRRACNNKRNDSSTIDRLNVCTASTDHRSTPHGHAYAHTANCRPLIEFHASHKEDTGRENLVIESGVNSSSNRGHQLGSANYSLSVVDLSLKAAKIAQNNDRAVNTVVPPGYAFNSFIRQCVIPVFCRQRERETVQFAVLFLSEYDIGSIHRTQFGEQTCMHKSKYLRCICYSAALLCLHVGKLSGGGGGED